MLMKAISTAIAILIAILPFNAYSKNKSHKSHDTSDKTFEARMPEYIPAPGEKTIIVDPRLHAWGAYDAEGNLVRGGIATAGAGWCRDIGRSCRTKSGSFRIFSLGNSGCKSSKYPLPRGGAPMPYCMFFNGGQGLHGSNQIAAANLSHGCVRLHVESARWLRFEFVDGPNSQNDYRGTKVIVKPY